MMSLFRKSKFETLGDEQTPVAQAVAADVEPAPSYPTPPPSKPKDENRRAVPRGAIDCMTACMVAAGIPRSLQSSPMSPTPQVAARHEHPKIVAEHVRPRPVVLSAEEAAAAKRAFEEMTPAERAAFAARLGK